MGIYFKNIVIAECESAFELKFCTLLVHNGAVKFHAHRAEQYILINSYNHDANTHTVWKTIHHNFPEEKKNMQFLLPMNKLIKDLDNLTWYVELA